MKKLSKLSLLALASFALVGCSAPAGDSSFDWKPSIDSTESVAPVSSEADSYVEPSWPAEVAPSYSIPAIPEEPEPEPYQPVWQGFEAEDPEIKVGGQSSDAEGIQGVAEVLVMALWGDQLTLEECYSYDLIYIDDEDDWMYYVNCNFGSGDVDTVANTLVSYIENGIMADVLPEYEIVYDKGEVSVASTDYAYVRYWATEVEADAICIKEMDYLLTSNQKMCSQFCIGYLKDFFNI